MDPLQGLCRVPSGSVIEGVDRAEELLQFAVHLSDKDKYDNKRKDHVGESLKPGTIKGYVSTARKRLELETGERIQKTMRYREWMSKMMSVPGVSGFMAPAPKTLVSKLVQNPLISSGVRAAAAACFSMTMRMGECASRLTTVFNSARALRLGDVSFAVDAQGKRTAVIFCTRGSKADPTNTGGVRIASAAQDEDMLCPVQVLGDFYDSCVARKFSTNEPFFRHPDGKLVTTAHMSTQIKRTAKELGLDPAWYGNHSFRVGSSTAMTEADLSAEDKRIQGAWRTLVGSTPYMRQTSAGLLRTGKALAVQKQCVPNVDSLANVAPLGRPRFGRAALGQDLVVL